jgi:nicotinamidase-related amidase
LVVTGVTAETCVETTIRDAYDQDYFVVVPAHSIGSNDPQQLEARMKYWAGGHVGDVVEEETIEENWSPT